MNKDEKQVDLFVELQSYRSIYENFSVRNDADELFEKTKDIKKVDAFCKAILKKPLIDKLLKQSKINKRFQLCTFDAYQTNEEFQKTAKDKAFEYAENINEILKTGTNLFLVGGGCVGTGKTHLACAIAHKVIEQNIPAKFINVTSMIAEIKEKFDISEFINVDLLIIDDLGKENGTNWVCETIYSIINQRYEAMKPTVITTEGNIASLKENYGEKGKAIISRLIQDFYLINLSGNDYRQKRD